MFTDEKCNLFFSDMKDVFYSNLPIPEPKHFWIIVLCATKTVGIIPTPRGKVNFSAECYAVLMCSHNIEIVDKGLFWFSQCEVHGPSAQ